MKKIAIVIGTRPEGIKLAPIINAILHDYSDQFVPFVIATGQHEAVLDDVFSFFNIQPDIVLTIDRGNQALSALQAQLIQSLEQVFIAESPDIVMVQGDTISTLAGAIAAYYQKIPIAHVEAGLRSGDIYEPFPEEANRRMVTQLSQWHFTPTPIATAALKSEGIESNVHEVGNTVIDALMHVKNIGFNHPDHQHSWAAQFETGRRMMLVTLHRRENWGAGLDQVMAAAKQLVSTHNDLDIVWLTHPNPDIKQQVNKTLGQTKNIYIYPPANYIELVQLMSLSTMILTDSGGIQEEAPSLNKPVLVARDITERMEGVTAGCATLVGTDSTKIVTEVTKLLNSDEAYRQMVNIVNPYGDGTTSNQILNILAG